MIAHLVSHQLKKGCGPLDAVRAALPRLEGAFALAFLFDGCENLIVGARKGSPLAVGYGRGEMYLGSDAIALAPLTNTVNYLEDGDITVITRQGIELLNAKGERLSVGLPRKEPVPRSERSLRNHKNPRHHHDAGHRPESLAQP